MSSFFNLFISNNFWSGQSKSLKTKINQSWEFPERAFKRFFFSTFFFEPRSSEEPLVAAEASLSATLNLRKLFLPTTNTYYSLEFDRGLAFFNNFTQQQEPMWYANNSFLPHRRSVSTVFSNLGGHSRLFSLQHSTENSCLSALAVSKNNGFNANNFVNFNNFSNFFEKTHSIFSPYPNTRQVSFSPYRNLYLNKFQSTLWASVTINVMLSGSAALPRLVTTQTWIFRQFWAFNRLSLTERPCLLFSKPQLLYLLKRRSLTDLIKISPDYLSYTFKKLTTLLRLNSSFLILGLTGKWSLGVSQKCLPSVFFFIESFYKALVKQNSQHLLYRPAHKQLLGVSLNFFEKALLYLSSEIYQKTCNFRSSNHVTLTFARFTANTTSFSLLQPKQSELVSWKFLFVWVQSTPLTPLPQLFFLLRYKFFNLLSYYLKLSSVYAEPATSFENYLKLGPFKGLTLARHALPSRLKNKELSSFAQLYLTASDLNIPVSSANHEGLYLNNLITWDSALLLFADEPVTQLFKYLNCELTATVTWKTKQMRGLSFNNRSSLQESSWCVDDLFFDKLSSAFLKSSRLALPDTFSFTEGGLSGIHSFHNNAISPLNLSAYGPSTPFNEYFFCARLIYLKPHITLNFLSKPFHNLFGSDLNGECQFTLVDSSFSRQTRFDANFFRASIDFFLITWV